MSEPIQAISTNNYLLAAPIGSGYMETSALEYDGDKISGYAGSAFKAGDELPQSVTDAANYVSAASGNIDATIENVSSNSGAWGGSALPISAGPGIKVNFVDNTLVFSNDETVLWSGNPISANTTAALSENITAFERVKVFGYTHNGSGYPWIAELPVIGSTIYGCGMSQWKDINKEIDMSRFSLSNTTVSSMSGTWLTGTNMGEVNSWVFKVIGINRK